VRVTRATRARSISGFGGPVEGWVDILNGCMICRGNGKSVWGVGGTGVGLEAMGMAFRCSTGHQGVISCVPYSITAAPLSEQP